MGGAMTTTSPSDAEALLPGNGGKVGAESSSSKTNTACRICCGVTVALLVWLLWVAFRIWTAECAIESFDVDLVLPKNAQDAQVNEPFDRGTAENQKDLDPDLDLDLRGVWWMDGNPLTAEQLVSFAGANGKAPYPTSVFNPSNFQRRWTWADTFIGRFLPAYYAFIASPDTAQNFSFVNSTYADIVPVSGVFGDGVFGFEYVNKDEWDRTDTYLLHRVIAADGTAGPYWEKFLAWYKGIYPSGRVVVYSSDNECLRKCQYFWPCFVCNWFC